jgi:hypothetical protein
LDNPDEIDVGPLSMFRYLETVGCIDGEKGVKHRPGALNKTVFLYRLAEVEVMNAPLVQEKVGAFQGKFFHAHTLVRQAVTALAGYLFQFRIPRRNLLRYGQFCRLEDLPFLRLNPSPYGV